MAEALSSNEIEDVLSSIRRLVAQDLKPADRAKLAAVAGVAPKLVLAPENRVEDRAPDAPKFVTVRRPSRRAAFPAIDEVLPGMDAAAAGAKQDWALGEHPDPADFVAPQNTQFSVNPAARLADVAPDAFLVPQFAADPCAEYEPTPEVDPAFETDAGTDWSDDTADMGGEEVGGDDLADMQSASAVPSFDGTIEPDADWADAAEARVIAELAGEAIEDAVLEAAQASFPEPNFPKRAHITPEVIYDEAALRTLVQTIFREEMAGPMGERITRNIRKLVRAEVGRMLAAHDLE